MRNDQAPELRPQQLRALAHPLRLRLLGMLRSDGPATATQLAGRVGENSGSTSYHLRQLARYGLVEEVADRGVGRERWWRAAFAMHRVGADFLYDPALRGALDVYLHEVLSRHMQNAAGWLAERRTWDRRWVEAATINDYLLRLTPERLRALVGELDAVVERYRVTEDPDGEQVIVDLHAFPWRSQGASGPGERGG